MVQTSSPQVTATIYPRDQHCVSRSHIDNDALKILYRLIRYGHKAYLVGGGVRDLLLRKKPKDFDIATDATPRQIKDLFRNSRVIGRRFKLVHVFFGGGKIIQVSTFRDFSDPAENEEQETANGSRLTTDNKYGSEVTDAQRRDITINGLFYDVSTFSIIDYVGGMPDLQNHIVRIIGDPDTRFAEDPVRLIRVVRHAARSGFSIDEDCYISLEKNLALLLTCSTMRVYEEIKKDLLSGSSLAILRLLNCSGLLNLLLPEIANTYGYLLSDSNQCAKSLEKLDLFVKDGHQISVTSVLALIALYSFGATPLDPKVSRFESIEVIPTFLKNCFTKLAVPKKEREKIEEILSLYHQLQNKGTALRVSSLRRRAVFAELVDFYELLNLGGAYDQILDHLNSRPDELESTLEEIELEETPSSQSRPRGRRGYGRRGRSSGRGSSHRSGTAHRGAPKGPSRGEE